MISGTSARRLTRIEDVPFLIHSLPVLRGPLSKRGGELFYRFSFRKNPEWHQSPWFFLIQQSDGRDDFLELRRDVDVRTGLSPAEQRLEEGNISLDKSLEQFEQGMKLIQFCEQKLEEVEKRIRVLVEEDGKLKLKMAHFLEKEDEAVEETPETEEDDGQPLFPNGDS